MPIKILKAKTPVKKIISQQTFTKKPAKKMPSTEELFREISQKAYQLFIERNCNHGCDMEDWFKAEKIIKAKYGLK